MKEERKKYLKLLMEKYPTRQSICREIINLNAIINLPKGTEHFMSDLHGEYDAFCHILNNCSGVVREKVRLLYGQTLDDTECREICTLIYYPKERLDMLHKASVTSDDWYRMRLNQLVEIAKLLSSKYTRSKVRKAMPKDFGYVIDELLHVQKDEDDNQVFYHKNIIDTILQINNADEFIIALAALIKRLAVDRLHIVGDIFDRGPYADKIMELLMTYHSLDIEWGNHDILWMGAASGNTACIATVVLNNLKHDNMKILESGYGISLRKLALFAEKTYQNLDPMEAAQKAITMILFKLEGQLIKLHPEYEMEDRAILEHIDVAAGVVTIDSVTYSLNDTDFPTLSAGHPYELTAGETEVIEELRDAFLQSTRLQQHISFLYENGSMYKVYNGNLLYHGCVPLDESGNFACVHIDGIPYQGRSYLDYAEVAARKAFFGKHNHNEVDFMWYLWCGRKSPLCGRKIRTFERTFINDKKAWVEESNPYFKFHEEERTCNMILREFGLYANSAHIINGHTPVRAIEGEQPIRANGKLLIIDGGFCQDYHETTGIAGYTLIFNSHGLRIKAHQPFESVKKVLNENKDIESDSHMIETENARVMVKDTDVGKQILEDIADLEELMICVENGTLV